MIIISDRRVSPSCCEHTQQELRGAARAFGYHHMHSWERNGDAASFSAWAAGPRDEPCGPSSARSPSASPTPPDRMVAPLDAHSQSRQFLRAQRRIHSIGPIHRAFHRPRREDGLDRIVPRNPRPEIPGTPYRTPEMSMVSPELLRRMTNCHRLPARIVIAIWFAHRFARAWIRLLPKRIRVW